MLSGNELKLKNVCRKQLSCKRDNRTSVNIGPVLTRFWTVGYEYAIRPPDFYPKLPSLYSPDASVLSTIIMQQCNFSCVSTTDLAL